MTDMGALFIALGICLGLLEIAGAIEKLADKSTEQKNEVAKD